MSDYPVTSPRGQLLLSYLPDYYITSRVMRALCQARGVELDQARTALQDILKQFYVLTADEWGLKIWEDELGLPANDTETKTERQQRILSKLRGYGTATLKIIKSIADSYEKGYSDIAEDYGRYIIIIRFTDILGIPSNINDLKSVLREAIPAHLDILYEYNYFIWDKLDAQNWTWDQLDALNLTWDQLEVYK